MLKNIDKISVLPYHVVRFLEIVALDGNVDRIIIFGSRAFGDHEEYSDLDIAIDGEKLTKMNWLKLREFVSYDLRCVLRVSIVNYFSNPDKLKQRIIQTGIIIYEKQS